MTSEAMIIILVAALCITAAAVIVCIYVLNRALKKSGAGSISEGLLKNLAAKDDIRLLQDDNERTRAASERQAKQGRDELALRLDAVRDSISKSFFEFNETQARQWALIAQQMNTLRDAMAKNFILFNEAQAKQWDTMGQRIDGMSASNTERLEKIRVTVDEQLQKLQSSNEKKLDEMRGVVDEKLSKTLEERLGQSFKQVSDQLEQVYKSLGEVRSLSKDMGDIKNIFKNVKTRGTWGEVQLASLLEQMLTPEQYAANIKVRQGSDDNVEFAIKLPGQDDAASVVWLPIDSKFPMEDYERMMEAVERSDAEAMAQASKALEMRVVSQARTIRDKYINPPATTDFAILFVPIESLFAEILRRPGLSERLQREFHVTVAGPTTLAALLNSLRMGFRTLALQKSSSQVWKLLGAIKKQFGVFAENLMKVERNLELASKGVKEASNRTSLIQNRLDKVQELPIHEANQLLPLQMAAGDDSDYENNDMSL